MKKIKKILSIILTILIVMYIPTVVLATNVNDEKIIDEAKDYLKYNIDNANNPIELNGFKQLTKTYTYWKNKSIYVTRTSGSSGITAEVQNNGSHAVDVAIFSADTDKIIGHTQTAEPGKMTLMSWTNNEMYDKGTTSNIYVFLTMYNTYVNPLTITISY